MHIKNEEFTEAAESDGALSDDDNDNDQNHEGNLSSYEMERLANIKKNEMFFKELKMEEVITLDNLVKLFLRLDGLQELFLYCHVQPLHSHHSQQIQTCSWPACIL